MTKCVHFVREEDIEPGLQRWRNVLILPERKTLNLDSNGDELPVNFAREEDTELNSNGDEVSVHFAREEVIEPGPQRWRGVC